jgi:hypothetical protein
MTYQKAGRILATDFDGFLTTTSNVYGTGNSDRGYGQTTFAQAAVSIGDLIRSVHWTNLRSMIVTCANHQGTSVATLPPSSEFAVGHTIFAHEQASPSNNAYELLNNITLIDTDRLNVSNTSLSVATNVHTVTRATGWTGSITAEISVLWASENAARYYFNSGGQIRLIGSQPTSTPQNNAWENTLTNRVGTVRFAVHATTNSGYVNGSHAIGFYELTDSYQTIYNAAVSGGTYYYYSGDSVTISAKRLNYGGVNGGNGRGVQFRIVLQDTGLYYSATTASGTSFSFDNVKATTFLSGITSPVYSTITPF